MTSEDEPASVLGHEIEHIDHYHCAERAQVEAKATQSETRGDWRGGADSAQCVEGRL